MQYFLSLKNRGCNQIGRKTEAIFEEALKELKIEGRIGSFSKKDRNGVDYMISSKDDKEIAIQVKSSKKCAVHHVLRYPEIPVVRVKYQKDMTSREKRKLIRNTKLNVLEIIFHVKKPQ